MIVAGDCGCFWLQGGTAVDVTQIAAMAAPRYTCGTSRWTKRTFGEQRRTGVFGEVLFGGVHEIDGVYPSSTGLKTSATAFFLQAGGGFNISIARGVGLRAIEVD